jgi:predicted GIY-YIG superfamily endonuclease
MSLRAVRGVLTIGMGQANETSPDLPIDVSTVAVYLLHFDRKLGHAQHYLGYSEDLDQRLAAHRAGNGARLLEVLKERGISWQLARTWLDGDRKLERRLKRWHGGGQLCPGCDPEKAMRQGAMA